MSFFHVAAILVTVAALSSYLNQRYLRLPATIGLMAVALVASLALLASGRLGVLDLGPAAAFIRGVDLGDVLLHGMLAFLLFAGALHVDLGELRREAAAVSVLSTFGVAAATLVAGGLFFVATRALGFQLTLPWALLFGALISPTDPIAALGILRKSGAPRALETQLIGESLFNDGIGVLIFLAFVEGVRGGAVGTFSEVATSLVVESLGAVLLGAALGWVTYRLLRSVDAYEVEAMLTLALAMGSYSLAEIAGVSAPITVVVAGLIIGNQGRAFAMSEKTRHHLDSFWGLIDEILNAILFVLLGLEVLPEPLGLEHLLAVLLAIAVVLASRALSVALSALLIGRWHRADVPGLVVLVWGGLRGGISVALSISLPAGPEKDLIVAVTYGVVVFSVLVQGLTLGRVVRYLRARVPA
ncbi:MAG: sodium:proton antiporter [Thermoanaerobaculia bacterium]